METYRITASLPASERYGLRSQLRRAAVSVACNIVEGASRPKDPDYHRFLHIARGSACEVEYLFSVARRLTFIEPEHAAALEKRYSGLQAALWRLINPKKS